MSLSRRSFDGKPAGKPFTGDHAILNWNATPDGKTLFAVEMSINALYSFDLAAPGATLAGKNLGPLLAGTNEGEPPSARGRASGS